MREREADAPLVLYGNRFSSRLLLGTARYVSPRQYWIAIRCWRLPRRGRSRRLHGCNGGLNCKRHSSPTVSPLSLGKDIPPLRLRRLAQDVRMLSRLQSPLRAGRRILPGGHVYQLWLGLISHRSDCRTALGRYGLVDYKRHHLGGRVVLAARSGDNPVCPSSLDLSRSDCGSRPPVIHARLPPLKIITPSRNTDRLTRWA